MNCKHQERHGKKKGDIKDSASVFYSLSLSYKLNNT